MASKKAAATTPKKGRKTKSKADSSSKTSSSSFSLFTSSLPGIILAAGVAFWYQYQSQSSGGVGGGKDTNIDINKSETLGQQPPYFTPEAGSWEDGYYSSPIAGQNYPSTHAKLYPNGGIGEPTEVQFQSEEDFLSTGRLYNEFGQIVQNRFHFENGTA
jgi:hypothetical protein